MDRSRLDFLDNLLTEDHTVDFGFDFKGNRVLDLDFLLVSKLGRDCRHMLDSLSASEHATVNNLMCIKSLFGLIVHFLENLWVLPWQ